MKLHMTMNLKQFQDGLEKFAQKGDEFQQAESIVGYDEHYAIYVHENLEANHPIHRTHNCMGQAKFLEQPARENGDQIGGAIISNYTLTKNAGASLVVGGKVLKHLSQRLVPVDTGALKRSAFVKRVVGGKEIDV